MASDDELLRMADEFDETAAAQFRRRLRRLEDFRYDERQVKYWDTTTGQLLDARSVDGAIPKAWWPTTTSDRGKIVPVNPSKAINDVETGLTVESSTWWPGKERFIKDIVMTDKGMIPTPGAVCYNTYRPPEIPSETNGETAERWVEHVRRVFPDPVEHEHFFDFAAHMLQRADEKVNHGIVLAGVQGIGKDTALLPLRHGVGEHNAAEIEPDDVQSQFNGFVQSVLLVINEVRPHDEDFRASNFYNKIKPLLSSPPELLQMELKFANRIYVRNICHVVMTTNEPLNMYIPPEDRRLFVMNSPLPDPRRSPVFPADYFDEMYAYFERGGIAAVVRWLLDRDLSRFRPGAPPPMTEGKRQVIESATQVRRTPVDEVLERFFEEVYGDSQPPVFFLRDLLDFVDYGPWFDDKKSLRAAIMAKNMHFKMNDRGYEMVREPSGNEWRNRPKFRSRLAFCLKSIPADRRVRLVREELERRPLAFDFDSKS